MHSISKFNIGWEKYVSLRHGVWEWKWEWVGMGTAPWE